MSLHFVFLPCFLEKVKGILAFSESQPGATSPPNSLLSFSRHKPAYPLSHSCHVSRLAPLVCEYGCRSHPLSSSSHRKAHSYLELALVSCSPMLPPTHSYLELALVSNSFPIPIFPLCQERTPRSPRSTYPGGARERVH